MAGVTPSAKVNRNPVPAGANSAAYARAEDLNPIVDAIQGATGGALAPLALTSTSGNNARTLADRADDLTNIKDFLQAGDSAALIAAAAVAVANNTTLVINRRLFCNTAVGTVSCPVRFEGNGAIDTTGGGTVTLTGPLTAANRQIIYGTGVTFQAKVNVTIPQWWGATGDGVTDDTAAIQAAITAANGKDVFLPAGTYLVSSLHNVVGTALRLVGAGRAQTTIQATASAAYVFPIDQTASANHHFLAGFTLSGTASNAGGIILGHDTGTGTTYRSAYSILRDLTITGFSGASASAIELDVVQEIDIENVMITFNTIGILRPNTGYLTSVRVSGFGGPNIGNQYGIRFTGNAWDFTVRSTVIESNTVAGIHASGQMVSLIVDGVYFEDNGHTGVGHVGTIYVDGLAGVNRSKLVLMNSHFFPAAANTVDPQITLDRVASSLVAGNKGLFREGGISTTANTECHFVGNSQPDGFDTGRPWASANMVSILTAQAGKVSFDQTGLDGNRYVGTLESAASGAILERQGASTGAQWIRIDNTGGQTYFGRESSTPNFFFTGSEAYATAVQSLSTPIQLIAGVTSSGVTSFRGTRVDFGGGVSPGAPGGGPQAARIFMGAAAPVAGTFAVGDRVINNAPAVGQPKAWACTVAGTPGTWVSEGNL